MAIIIPKKDNSGNPIRKDLIDEIKKGISYCFGGVTVIKDTAGCYVINEGEHKGKLQCEDSSILFVSVPEELLPEARNWIRKNTKQWAIDFGQESIMARYTDNETEFIIGNRRDEAPEVTIHKDVYPEDVRTYPKHMCKE